MLFYNRFVLIWLVADLFIKHKVLVVHKAVGFNIVGYHLARKLQASVLGNRKVIDVVISVFFNLLIQLFSSIFDLTFGQFRQKVGLLTIIRGAYVLNRSVKTDINGIMLGCVMAERL